MNTSLFPNQELFSTLAGTNIYILNGEYWRLITPIFIHVAFAHVLFNSFSLILFGPALERALGKGLFIIAYIGSGIGANIATLMIKPPYYTHIGASGAIFGLFGIYLAVLLFNKHAMPFYGKQVILPMVAISVIMTFFSPNVNIIGHLFGLASGFIIGRIILQFKSIHFH